MRKASSSASSSFCKFSFLIDCPGITPLPRRVAEIVREIAVGHTGLPVLHTLIFDFLNHRTGSVLAQTGLLFRLGRAV